MISDTLSEALSEMHRYRTDPAFAKAYSEQGLSERLDRLAEHMRAVQLELDGSPLELEVASAAG